MKLSFDFMICFQKIELLISLLIRPLQFHSLLPHNIRILKSCRHVVHYSIFIINNDIEYINFRNQSSVAIAIILDLYTSYQSYCFFNRWQLASYEYTPILLDSTKLLATLYNSTHVWDITIY